MDLQTTRKLHEKFKIKETDATGSKSQYSTNDKYIKTVHVFIEIILSRIDETKKTKDEALRFLSHSFGNSTIF